MMISGRSLKTILTAPLKKQHYIALLQMFKIYDAPLEMLRRYLKHVGEYPFWTSVRTPVGKIKVLLYSRHDVFTINEIFCRQDYYASTDVGLVIDIGSNIGLSALYFLTRNSKSRVILFEPLPANIEKLRKTLKGFEDRYTLFEMALGTQDGQFEFGYEPTGRYGGLGKDTGSQIQVPCRSADAILQEIFSPSENSYADILKIDIEGQENEIVKSLSTATLDHFGAIFAEMPEKGCKFQGFKRSRYGSIVRWKRTDALKQ